MTRKVMGSPDRVETPVKDAPSRVDAPFSRSSPMMNLSLRHDSASSALKPQLARSRAWRKCHHVSPPTPRHGKVGYIHVAADDHLPLEGVVRGGPFPSDAVARVQKRLEVP